MSRSLARVIAALSEAGIDSHPVEMPQETRTAQQAADAAGCALDQIVKSILFQSTSGQLFLFLTPGGHQVDPARASALAGESLGRAEIAVVRQVTGFAIGGVAPIGHLTPCPTWMAPRLFDFDQVWAAAGTPRHVFPVTPLALQRASGATTALFSTPAGRM